MGAYSALLTAALLWTPAWAAAMVDDSSALPPLGDFLGGERRPAALRGRGSESWEDRMLRLWGDGLDRLSSAADLAPLLRGSATRVRFVEGGELGDNLAGNGSGTILLNRAEFRRMRDALSQDGMPEEEADKALALKTLPVLAHELQHARNQKALAEAAGSPFEFPLLEDEASAFALEARVAAELRAARPELGTLRLPLDAEYDKIQEAARRGVEGLWAFVRERYKGIPSVLESPGAELGRRYGELARSLEGRAAWAAQLRSALAQAGSERERLDILAALRGLGSQAELSRLARNAREAESFLSDPSRADRLRAYYDPR